MPLNSYVSLNKPVFEDDGERTLIETINHDMVSDPELLFISKEELNRIDSELLDKTYDPNRSQRFKKTI